jgi:hypothetical protein
MSHDARYGDEEWNNYLTVGISVIVYLFKSQNIVFEWLLNPSMYNALILLVDWLSQIYSK